MSPLEYDLDFFGDIYDDMCISELYTKRSDCVIGNKRGATIECGSLYIKHKDCDKITHPEKYQKIMLLANIPFECLDKESIFYFPLLLSGTDDMIVLFMNDVHYYLSGFSPSYKCTMYISGCDFYPIPGFYTLPCGEG